MDMDEKSLALAIEKREVILMSEEVKIYSTPT